MKKIVYFLILIILPISSFAQKPRRSQLYNEKGRLYADTTLKISPEQLHSWTLIEANVLGKLANSLTYPPASFRNGLHGKIIIALEYDNNLIKNIRVVSRKIGGDIEPVVIKTLEDNKNIILQEFKSPQTSIEVDSITRGTYFIPIVFQQLNFAQEVQKNHALPIIKVSNPIIIWITK